MFTLVTGKPGASKTSNIIAKLLKIKDRPIYYRGIKFTEEGKAKLGWHELDDVQALNWPDHVPDAAIVILDEAQQIFPVRPSSRAVPAGLTALETHRHRGLDIYFISQDPHLLDNHARKICNEHLHYSRPFGAPFVLQYHSGSGFVNPANKSELATCVQTKHGLPREVWGLYKSAEIHTHKFRPPKFMFFLIALPFLAALAVYFGWNSFMDNNSVNVEQVQSESPRGGVVPRLPSNDDARSNMSWSELLKPEIPSLPFTAPLYKKEAMQVRSVPRLAGCVTAKKAEFGCRCYTQRGTLLQSVPESVCVAFIRNGYFDHLIADSSVAAEVAGARYEPRAGAAMETSL